MHSILITLSLVAAVVLIHFSYVDFRFRYRDGMLWFWLLNPAPPLMWVGRVTAIAALIVALSVPFFHATKIVAFVLAGVMAVHILTLILLEVLEPR